MNDEVSPFATMTGASSGTGGGSVSFGEASTAAAAAVCFEKAFFPLGDAPGALSLIRDGDHASVPKSAASIFSLSDLSSAPGFLVADLAYAAA